MGDSDEEIVQLPEVTPSFSGGLPFGSDQQLDCENRSIIQYTSSPRIGTWLHLGFKHAYSLFYQPIWLGYNSRVGSRHTVCSSKEGWQTFSQLWLDGEPPQSDMWILVHSPTSKKHTKDVHMMGIITLEDVIEKLIQVDSWDCWLVTGGANDWRFFGGGFFFVRSLSLGNVPNYWKKLRKNTLFLNTKDAMQERNPVSSGLMTFLVRKHPFLVAWSPFFLFLSTRKTLKMKATPWREHARSEVPTPWRCPGKSSFAVHGSWWHSMDQQKMPQGPSLGWWSRWQGLSGNL